MCQTVNFTWKCICIDSTLYYGEYCQYQTNRLQIKQTLTKSFASIAIIAISLTCAFIVFMDVLKYGFHIDPVQIERRQLRKHQRRLARPSIKPKVAVRFQYIS